MSITGRRQRDRTGKAINHTLFSRRFTAGDRSTRLVLAELVAVMRDTGIHGDDRATVELVLAEALNNIAEHAYADAQGPVELRVTTGSGGLVCHITDSGRPMPSGEAPDPPLPTLAPPTDIPEGGFGWHIIRCLTTELSYKRGAEHNILAMVVPLEARD